MSELAERDLLGALELLDRRRPDLAESMLREAVTADPGDAFTHSVLALVLVELDRFVKPSTPHGKRSHSIRRSLWRTERLHARWSGSAATARPRGRREKQSGSTRSNTATTCFSRAVCSGGETGPELARMRRRR